MAEPPCGGGGGGAFLFLPFWPEVTVVDLDLGFVFVEVVDDTLLFEA